MRTVCNLNIADGTDENNTPVEALQKMFLCPSNCDFSNEDEDIFLIHLTENHGFLKWAPCQDNYEAYHLCTFSCSTWKMNLQNIQSDVHQNHREGWQYQW